MLTKRIIPCLDVRNGKVVKGVNFEGVAEVGELIDLAKRYNDEGADELVFYDITASVEGRGLFLDALEKVASQIFIPLTVGGGISSLDDFARVLNSGADKVSVNSGAIKNPELLRLASERYGSQCVVLSLDVKRVDGRFTLFTKGGRENTNIDAISFAKQGEKLGAGELVINSIDTDGVKKGFDIQMLTAFSQSVNIPIIASGGAGKVQDFSELFALDIADAGLAASIFHFGEVSIQEIKNTLKKEGVSVRV